jgi:hypothetical protein
MRRSARNSNIAPATKTNSRLISIFSAQPGSAPLTGI